MIISMGIMEKCAAATKKCLLLLSFVNVVFSSLGPPCMSPLGLEFGLREHSLSFVMAVSSGEPGSIRLNGPKAWRPESISGSFVEINISQPILLTAVQVQGDDRMTGQISAWFLDTSADCEVYHTQNYSLGLTSPVHTETVYMKSLEFVSCIRLRPTHFKGKVPALRLELLGCVVHDTSSCGQDVHPKSEIWMDNGARQLNFGHQIVLSWVKILLDLQAHGDSGDAGIFYSQSCDHWDFYEPAETSVISPTTADGKSSWMTIELNKPVRAKCVRVFPPFATTLREVYTSRCNPHPTSTIREARIGSAVKDYGEDPQAKNTAAFQRDAPSVPQEPQSTEMKHDSLPETHHKEKASVTTPTAKPLDKDLPNPTDLAKTEDLAYDKDHGLKMNETTLFSTSASPTEPTVDTITTAETESENEATTNTENSRQDSSSQETPLSLSEIMFNGERSNTTHDDNKAFVEAEQQYNPTTVSYKFVLEQEKSNEQDGLPEIVTTTDAVTTTDVVTNMQQQNTKNITTKQPSTTTDVITDKQISTTTENVTAKEEDRLTTTDFVTISPQTTKENPSCRNETINDTASVTESSTSYLTDTTSHVTETTARMTETDSRVTETIARVTETTVPATETDSRVTETPTAHFTETTTRIADTTDYRNSQSSTPVLVGTNEPNGYISGTVVISNDVSEEHGTELHPRDTSTKTNLDSVMMADSGHQGVNHSECGRRRLAKGTRPKRVISGHQNQPGEWPWLVSMHFLPEINFTLNSGYKHTCGATIIAEDWLLTAAHCFTDEVEKGLSNITEWRLFFGMHDLAREDDQSYIQERLINSVYIYPKFNFTGDPLIYDLALVKLNESVVFNERVSRVCLDYTDVYYQEMQCVVTGWGQLETTSPGSRFPHTAAVTTMTQSKCKSKYELLPDDHPFKAFVRIQSPVLCAAIGSSGEDACQGDSGGPLMCESNGRWSQAGVAAAGFLCGNEPTPGLYTRVSYYADWIRKTIALHDD